jgi:hypothetical protein
MIGNGQSSKQSRQIFIRATNHTPARHLETRSGWFLSKTRPIAMPHGPPTAAHRPKPAFDAMRDPSGKDRKTHTSISGLATYRADHRCSGDGTVIPVACGGRRRQPEPVSGNIAPLLPARSECDRDASRVGHRKIPLLAYAHQQTKVDGQAASSTDRVTISDCAWLCRARCTHTRSCIVGLHWILNRWWYGHLAIERPTAPSCNGPAPAGVHYLSPEMPGETL